MVIRALRHRWKGIANRITTTVEIVNPAAGVKAETIAIWDTGSTNSGITARMAQYLGLEPINEAKITSVQGEQIVPVYEVKLVLQNRDISMNLTVHECSELSVIEDVGMIIGMDVINQGDFAVSNYIGDTTMSFRVPSIRRIDFVEVINNTKCRCGSGKKYIDCCGK